MADRRKGLTQLERDVLTVLARGSRERDALTALLQWPSRLDERLDQLAARGLVARMGGMPKFWQLTDAGRKRVPGPTLRMRCMHCGRTVLVHHVDLRGLELSLRPMDAGGSPASFLPCPFCLVERGGTYPLEGPRPRKKGGTDASA